MKQFSFLLFVSLGFFLCGVPLVSAQESLALSVTPPLFQLNVTPGDTWRSSIKIINSNPYEITVYAQLYDFAPKGEDGQGIFLARMPHEEGALGTLADWIAVTGDAIVIPPEKSKDVPITVLIPERASPGGHFASLLVGTKPPEKNGTSVVRTSQVVTSLFFMRVAGDVKEAGQVREFSVAHLFREKPEADFILRFQNDGNVHLQPQGGITIYNMWGKERGFIPVNQQSHFGNVLPDSIRRFDFTWHGESSLSDIGRYMAEVVLTYGTDGRQNTSSKVYFWVVPLKATLITLVSLAVFIFFCIWIIRRYVRRVLYVSGYTGSDLEAKYERKKLRARDFSSPLKEGVLDLRRLKDKDTASFLTSLWQYVRQYYLFFIGCILLIVFFALSWWYFGDVLKKEKTYEIIVPEGNHVI